MVVIISVTLYSCGTVSSSSDNKDTSTLSVDKQYLKAYFDIEITEDTLTNENLTKSLSSVSNSENVKLDNLSSIAFLKESVIASGFNELALSYGKEKS